MHGSRWMIKIKIDFEMSLILNQSLTMITCGTCVCTWFIETETHVLTFIYFLVLYCIYSMFLYVLLYYFIFLVRIFVFIVDFFVFLCWNA